MEKGLKIQKTLVFALCLLLGSLAYVGPANAYLDPGTGSMILQGIIGVVAAAAAVTGIYWQKVKSFFNKKAPTEQEETTVSRDGD